MLVKNPYCTIWPNILKDSSIRVQDCRENCTLYKHERQRKLQKWGWILLPLNLDERKSKGPLMVSYNVKETLSYVSSFSEFLGRGFHFNLLYFKWPLLTI
jgi:hypothetical protein